MFKKVLKIEQEIAVFLKAIQNIGKCLDILLTRGAAKRCLIQGTQPKLNYNIGKIRLFSKGRC